MSIKSTALRLIGRKKEPISEEILLNRLQKKENRIRFFNTRGYLLLCMIIPAILMYLIYVARGVYNTRAIYPFGDGSVLVLDLAGQYVWFFEALRNTVWGDASLLYSFARALGGEFLGIYSYYIASPLSYIVCLFPKDRMLEALLTLFLLKTAICGGTFGYYMHRTLKEKKPLAIIVFSVFYALSAYAVVQQHNTMWIDALMWLPLLTLGIEELIKHGKFKMYTIFLALTVWSNFYIGYMVCIYCAIYFFLYYIAHGEENRNNPLRERFHFLKSLLRIAIYSIIALGIAAVVLLGAYYALNFGKTTFSTTKWEFLTNFDLLDLFYKFLPGSYDTVRPEGLPFVYCGLLTLLFIPAYFLSKKYPMRQKIVSGVMIFVFVAIATLNITDLVMHGFQAPNWLNYRYSFMLSFYLCVLACRAFATFESVSMQALFGAGGLIALLCVILQKYSDGEFVDPNDYTTIWFTLILLFVYLSTLAILKTTNKKRLVSIVLILFVCAETLTAGLVHLNELDSDVGYTNYRHYNNFLDKTRPIVDAVQEKDGGFYRMEKTTFRSTNDNNALEMRGLSGSTSTLNKETVEFLNKMGYASESHWSKYLGGTPVNDSLLGVKYIISDNDIYKNYYQKFLTDDANGYTAYYNPYALSIAYGVSDKVLEFPLGYTNVVEQKEEQKDSSVHEIEEVGSLFDTIKGKLNEWFGIDETQTNSEYVDEYDSPFERLNAIITSMLGAEETTKVFSAIPLDKDDIRETDLSSTLIYDTKTDASYRKYLPTREDISGILSYTVNVERDGEIYFYLPSEYPREVKLSVKTKINGSESDLTEIGSFYGNETHRIVSLGYYKAGTALTLNMELQKDVLYILDKQDCFYQIDYEVFENAINTLGRDQLVVTEHTETQIHGTFTASKENETVLTTIPYDKGWKIYVDGEEVETTKALGALISFQIDGDAGQSHEISMIYRPNTYVIGLTVTLACTGLLVLLIIFEKRMKKVPVLRALVTAVPRKSADTVESSSIELIIDDTTDQTDQH